MQLLITTQVQENYGAHDWDGTGECPQYWKFKGGSDYMVTIDGFNPDHEFADKKLEMIVDSIRPKLETDSLGYREYIIGYGIVADDYLTDFEKSQLEYEGEIAYPAKRLTLEQLQEAV